MLDKSVPFKHIMMRRPAGHPLPSWSLPDGYSFAFYQPGDERDWAVIESSVLEFPSTIDALLFFQKEYGAYSRELHRRVVFVVAPNGDKVGTGSAWFDYTGTRRDPWLDWIGVMPDFQGLGLGKAIAARILALEVEIEGDRDVFLHTQTWSHRAVKIYQKIGFEFTREKNLRGCTIDDFDEAMAILAAIDAR
ncbi:MAG: GNAT family N-acetyltransferase [Planctomycetes bacterium]|nr:GNAT family N-acetyltransferase [Planctomycetota bacterium]